MALGRNKDKAAQAPSSVLIEEEEEPGGLFAGDPAEAEDAPTAPLAAAPPVEPAPAPAPAAGADALLSMFQASQGELEDRSAVLELAGEVELVDLLEDLHTVAAALGIRVAAA